MYILIGCLFSVYRSAKLINSFGLVTGPASSDAL